MGGLTHSRDDCRIVVQVYSELWAAFLPQCRSWRDSSKSQRADESESAFYYCFYCCWLRGGGLGILYMVLDC